MDTYFKSQMLDGTVHTQVYAWYVPGSDNIISNLLIKKTNFISLLNYVWRWINFNLQ